MGYPSVYPTGVTVYDPSRTWNGYTIFQAAGRGALLIDMKSPFISSAQRLPNGNTLITEGSDGRIFEVTADHELVWEYVSPYWGNGNLNMNLVYRAYRAPYDWVPQLPEP